MEGARRTHLVCEACVRRRPARFELISEKCCEPASHDGSARVRAVWIPELRRLSVVDGRRESDDAKPRARAGARRQPGPRPATVRPMPRVAFKGEFRLCNRHLDCPRGDRCTFAHSEEEVDQWNEQRRRIQSPATPTPVSRLPPSRPQPSHLQLSHPQPPHPTLPRPPSSPWAPGAKSFAAIVSGGRNRHASDPLPQSQLSPPRVARPQQERPPVPASAVPTARRPVLMKDFIPATAWAGPPRAGSPRAGSPRAGPPRAGPPRAAPPRAGPPPRAGAKEGRSSQPSSHAPPASHQGPRLPISSLPNDWVLSELHKAKTSEWPDFTPPPTEPHSTPLVMAGQLEGERASSEDFTVDWPVFSPTNPPEALLPPAPAPARPSPEPGWQAGPPPDPGWQAGPPPEPGWQARSSLRPEASVFLPHTLPPAMAHTPPPAMAGHHGGGLATPQPAPPQKPETAYAASKADFQMRLTEPLILADVEQKLTPANYREKFHKLLCWEEKEHIRLLFEKCDGCYPLVLHQARLNKPPWLRNASTIDHKRFGYIKGLSGDQLAYAAQASEAVFVSVPPGEEVMLIVLQANLNHNEERLYVAVHRNEVGALKSCLGLTEAECELTVTVRFDLKHSYFNRLHQSLSNLTEDVIARLFPKWSDFRLHPTPISPELMRSLQLKEMSIPQDKMRALESIISCPASGPPVLVSGAFGTGKTLLLALACHYFFQESKLTNQPVRILVCTQQQTSADAFLECFVEKLLRPDNTVSISRLVIRDSASKDPKLQRWCKTVSRFRREYHYHAVNHIVITTCMSSLNLVSFLKGFFTHIFLDEGAQTREPEGIAPLALAGRDTKIIIAGDKHQVGPSMLVLGAEPQAHGLALSLLERLEQRCIDVWPAASSHTSVLNTNYRCHRAILELAEELFYKIHLICRVPDCTAPPSTPYPLLFVCSSIDEAAPSAGQACNEREARILLEQVALHVGSWPAHCGGPQNPQDEICIVSPHKSQIALLWRLQSQVLPHNLKRIRRYPTYDLQGREFIAVFLSTAEPVEGDGSPCNPTKSTCDPHVFNTAITRARSLVVAVGNPFLLLRSEQHMVQRYGAEGTCWSSFLRVCLRHASFFVAPAVGASAGEEDRCRERLRALTAARHQLSSTH